MIIQTPTPDLDASISFYDTLGYKTLSKENPTIVTDGAYLLEINPTRTARAGVKMYKDSWESTVSSLSPKIKVHEMEEGYYLSDPSGAWIYLIAGDEPKFTIPGESSSVFGKYMGYSLESPDIEKSIAIWEILGFTISMGGIEQGWLAMTDEHGNGVSIMKPMMCPHLFFNPSISFFNSGKNPEIIAKIRSLKIPITEEITLFNDKGIVDNIIVRDPGGFGFFVFND